MALVFEHLFYQRHALLHRQIALQTGIVDTSHGSGVDVLILRCLGETVVPLLIDGLAVGLVVPVAVALFVPLALVGIVQQKRFAVGGGDDDAEGVADYLALRMRIEGSCTGVHGRCQHICL